MVVSVTLGFMLYALIVQKNKNVEIQICEAWRSEL